MAVGALCGAAHGAELPDVIDLSAFGSRGVQLTSDIYGQGKLSPVGDVNGDGLADFLTTGQGSLSSGYHGPIAFLVLGAATMDPVTALGGPGGNIVAFTSSDNERLFFGAAAGVGDVSGDGLDDFLISAPDHPEGIWAGRVYLVFGHQDLEGGMELDLDSDELSVVTFHASVEETLLGAFASAQNPLAGIGDFDGDGINDFAMGAPYAAVEGQRSVGRTFVVFWRPELLEVGDIDVERIGVDVPGFIAEGELHGEDYECAGRYVAGIGDANGDGLQDVLIGAPCYGNEHAERAYLVFGSSSAPGRLHLGSLGERGVRIGGALTRPAEGDASGLGDALSAAGDVNRDGFADFLLGAQGDCCKFITPTLPGRTYLVYGRARWPLELGLEAEVGQSVVAFEDAEPGDHSGFSVAHAGDLNGDGASDFLIGASYADRKGGLRVGEAYAIYGGNLQGRYSLAAVPEQLAGVLIRGDFDHDTTGWSLAGLGDINGDGLPDYAVGAHRELGPEAVRAQQSMRTYIVHGTGGRVPLGLTRVEPASGALEGGYEASVFGSGFTEDAVVRVGGRPATVVRRVSSSEMRVLVPPGRERGAVEVEVERGQEIARLAGGFEYTRRFPHVDLASPGRGVTTLRGDGTVVPFAYALTACDLNADGRDDLVIGATATAEGSARVVILHGRPEGPSGRLPYLELPPPGQGFILRAPQFGLNGKLNVDGGQDVNGDGVGDLLLGAAPGDAFVLFGRRDLTGERTLDECLQDGSAARISHGTVFLPLDGEGFHAAGLGDLDGDGIAEVGVGLANEGIGGAVYIVRGRRTWPETLDLGEADGVLKITSPFSSRIGRDLALAGDFDGDRSPDLLVGTIGPVFPAQGSGWAYLVFGRDVLEGELDLEELVLAGEAVELELQSGFDAYHQSTVHGAGDFNGDGAADILVTVLDAGGRRQGHTYVVYGGQELPLRLSLPGQLEGRGVVIEGELGDDMTAGAASLGDFDGDGIDDLLIGAPGPHNVEAGGTPGKAFVVLGARDFPEHLSLARLGDRGFRIDGVVPFGLAGNRVAGGDFDGDGLGDAIIGESGHAGAPGNVYLIRSPYGGSTFIRGDANFDAEVNISDAISVLAFLFLGGSPLRCEDAADADDSGALDISDAVRILSSLFIGDASVPPPYPGAGADPTADELGCVGF